MHRTIVTLCGSTRFFSTFHRVNHDETLAGRIVLSVGFYPCVERCSTEEIAALDLLHLDTIAMSNEILVLNVGGYVGESTRNEIAFAILRHKPIRWLVPELGGDAWLAANSHDIGRRVADHVSAGRAP